MLFTTTAASPLLLKNALFCTSPAPTVELKDTVIGCIVKRAAAELEVPLKVIGVLDEEPAAALEVVITTSLESGPTAFGVNRVWNENCCPAVRTNGKVGRVSLDIAKLAPVRLKAVIVVPTLAVQVIGSASDVPLTDVFAKLTGPVQLSGRLTGEPNAYSAPVVPIKALPSPKPGRANFPGLLKLKALSSFNEPPSLGGLAS